MQTSESSVPRAPVGLGSRGRNLWRDLHKLGIYFDPAQTVLIAEACRIADRLERLDEILRGDTGTWASLVHDLRTEDYELKIDGAMSEARQQQNVLKQILVALRLPDGATGKQPQRRGARGSYAGKGASGVVSSLERARQRSNGV